MKSKTVKIIVALICFIAAGFVILWSNGMILQSGPEAPEFETQYNADGSAIGSKDEEGRTVVRDGFTPPGRF